MQEQNARVMLASEYSEVRHFLREVVEEQGGVVIVGEAENVTRALTLARNLRPDIAVIDCCLPHAVGLDSIPLSRIGGLDIAQTISEEIPNTRVILVTNLDIKIAPEDVWGSDRTVCFYREKIGANIPFTLQELCLEVVQSSVLVFTNIEVKPPVALRQKVANISDKAILFGGLGILGGWFLIITMMFAQVGAFLALAGVVTLLFALAAKLTARLRHKAPQLGSQTKRGNRIG